MKKKKKYSVLTAVLLIITVIFAGAQEILPVQAASVEVYINGTRLQDGKYYEFIASGFTSTMYERASESELTSANYISYNNGVMRLYGSVYIYSDGNDTGGVLRIKNGTLTLTGDGHLYIKNSDLAPAASVVTGTSDSVLKTDSYTGSIMFSGNCGGSLIQGLALVDLKTTSDIGFTGSYITGDSFISAGSVKLEADNYSFDLTRTVNVKYFIEATDTQNGEISLSKTGTTNALRLKNGYVDPPSENIYVTDAFFKAKDTVIASNGTNGSESIFFKGNSIATGNLKITATYDITITTNSTLADGNLEISSDLASYITLTSTDGSLSTGNTNINASFANADLTGKGPEAAIKGNATIKARVLEITGDQNSAIAGNANLTTDAGGIKLSAPEGYSVIAGDTIQMAAANYDITILRTGSGSTDTPPILGGPLQVNKGAVHYDDCGTRWVQVMETGKIYYADNCEHPIINGSYGQCLVCGNYNIEYAELIGADGALKRKLYEVFGGVSPDNDINKVSDGDTIKLIKDLYCPLRIIFLNNKAVTLDLDGHTLTLGEYNTENSLTVMDGTYTGTRILTTSPNCLLTFKNVNSTLTSLYWSNTTDGVKLENSKITIAKEAMRNICRFEKLTMDEDSKLVIQGVQEGIVNNGSLTLEDSLGSIQDFLPTGYSIERTNFSTSSTGFRNTIVDSNGNAATDIVLRYRRMTDEDASITLNGTFIYDKTAKKPELLVTYDGQELVRGTDYTVAYTDNTNAGDATVTVTGIGAYHGSVQLRFTIEKADQTAPSGLIAVKASKSGASDGALENLSSAMEYSTDKINWTAVTSGTKINGLAAGDYYVRYAATENFNASPATKVVVSIAEAPSSEGGSTTEAATGKDDANGANTVSTGDETPLGMVLLLVFGAAGMMLATIAGKKGKAVG